jgi:hypothetical protein
MKSASPVSGEALFKKCQTFASKEHPFSRKPENQVMMMQMNEIFCHLK